MTLILTFGSPKIGKNDEDKKPNAVFDFKSNFENSTIDTTIQDLNFMMGIETMRIIRTLHMGVIDG